MKPTTVRGWALVALVLTSAGVVSAQPRDLGTAAKDYLVDRGSRLATTSNPSERLYLLRYLGPAAFVAGDFEAARRHSLEMLTLGRELRTFPGFGPLLFGIGTHVGHVMLGRLALVAGDLEGASRHLLAAGAVPVLNEFGPDMMLAQELIARGERRAVMQYFDACARFWKSDGGRLDQWKQVVAHGGMPSFGFQLRVVQDLWRAEKGILDR